MKDSFWFRHDSNAHEDLKLVRIKRIHTHWGIGIFWEVIEVLRNQNNYKYSINESDLQFLCEDIIRCNDFARFKSWLNDCFDMKPEPIFQKDKNSFWSESLITRMRKWESCKDNGSKPKKKEKKANSKPIKSELKANSEHKIRLDKNILDYKDKKIEEAWLIWVEYKKNQFKFRYKTTSSEQIGINELIKLCDNNFDLALSIVNQSISNGWKGLFALKNISKNRVDEINSW